MSKHIAPTRRTKNDIDNTSVIILSGNVGNRMKIYGSKSMYKVGKGTLLQHQLKTLYKKFTHAEIVLVTGFDADRVIKNAPENVRIVENVRYNETNEVEQIRLGLNNITTNSALIIDGDIFFDFNTIKPITNESCLVVENLNMIEENSIGITSENGIINTIGYGLTPRWCNITYLVDKELKLVKQFCKDRSNEKMYFSEILSSIVHKCKLKVVEPVPAHIIHANNSQNIERIK